MSEESAKAYAEKIHRVCSYITEHLNDDLSVEKLSRLACFSKFHFHRQFVEYTGINVAKFILMQRLKRASYQLVYNKDDRIIEIAINAGFENPESFSRAFKKTFGYTPSQFRNEPEWNSWNGKFRFKTIESMKIMKIDIITFVETKVAVLEHRGPADLLNNSISRFIEWRKENRFSPETSSKTFGLAYDDPKATASEKFRFDICGSVESDVPKNPQGIINKTIPAGRCAVTRHLGSHAGLDSKVHYLYGKWLPENDEVLRDFPCFFHYLNFFPEVAEHELITDIYLPLK